ncbi:hypothetical protein I6B53_07585 [Schaalia sp. 19OD2882]|uniref:amidase family protein n=1 Tax=Schaalia sp. 19OD2882 TaxID=2794089 RepID=UPI001C1EB161|nr:amidase family protein [Schaalia sp. 19OD2882]QWW18995.1 hypothetical protein I6B53_07585 [Schaalia sp. 19OD2882]
MNGTFGPSPDAVTIARQVSSGTTAPGEAVTASLERAEGVNAHLNAFTRIRRKEALAEAAALAARLADPRAHAGDLPLAGVPVAVKEEYDVTGDVTTLGGRGNSTPASADCEVVRRLRGAGAVIVARTNMPEFGHFPTTESEHHGPCLNPWDPTRSPGGSSGGSAVAVAAGVVPVAMGADGGGSLRIPASACGVMGMKPTRGRVSSAPLAQHWHGLATFGAITRSAVDMGVVLDVISGNVEVDRWRLEAPERPFADAAQGAPSRPLRILHTDTQVMPGMRLPPDVARAVDAFAVQVTTLGQDLRRGRAAWPVPTFPFLTLFAAGIHEELTQVEHPQLLERRTRASARIGARLPQAMVRAAVTDCQRVRAGVDAVFGGADLVMLPTMPVLPLGAHSLEGLGAARALAKCTPLVSNTAIFNVSGHPAMSVHAGFAPNGMPVGAQFVARWGREDLLLGLAGQLEQAGMLCAPVAEVD